MEWQDVIDSLYKGRDNIQLLFDMDSEHEDTLTDALCTGLKWTQSNLKLTI